MHGTRPFWPLKNQHEPYDSEWCFVRTLTLGLYWVIIVNSSYFGLQN